MASGEQHTLPSLEVEPHQLREILRCVFHTILFTRALNVVRPKNHDLELFDVSYVSCGDEDVDRTVESRITEVCDWAERARGGEAEISLYFYERSQRPGGGWAFPLMARPREERLVWEEWRLPVRVRPPRPPQETSGSAAAAEHEERRLVLQARLSDCVMGVLRGADAHRDRIPPVVSSGTVPFPFDVTVKSGKADVLQRARSLLMQATLPPKVLG